MYACWHSNYINTQGWTGFTGSIAYKMGVFLVRVLEHNDYENDYAGPPNLLEIIYSWSETIGIWGT